jgi:hypothetical protein
MARKQSSENPLVVSSGAAAAPARRKPTTTKRTVQPTVTPVASEPVALETAPAPIAAPDNNQIAALAYSFWEARGYQGGSPEADWLRAEQQLSALSAK